jgi:lipoprotein NlpI
MPALNLPVGSALWIQDGNNAWQKLTEHNRSPVSIDTQRFEQTSRMANGSLRKLFIADKKSVSTSWSMVPSRSTMTVDGGWGAEEIKTFYLSAKGQGTFNVRIAYNATEKEEFLASFTSCSFNMIKRNVKENAADTAQAFWDVTISLEEV